MLRILSATIVVILILVGIVFVIGLNAGPKVDTEFVVLMDYNSKYLFNFFEDIEKYPYRKNGLETLVVLDKQGQEIVRWRENYENGVWREYQIVGINPDKYLALEILASSDSLKGTIEFYFNEKDKYTEIFSSEKSTIDDVFMRGIRAISGDDSFLEDQIKWLRVAIQQDLIEKS